MNTFTKISAGLVGLAAVAGMAAPAFADYNTTPITTPINQTLDSTKMTCVLNAVTKREDAVQSAVNSFTTAINAALATRKTDLVAAYTNNTTRDALSAAIHAAWLKFQNSKIADKQNFRASRRTAWETFRTDVKACGAPEPTENMFNSSAEIN